jgi:hypothetical protein
MADVSAVSQLISAKEENISQKIAAGSDRPMPSSTTLPLALRRPV